MAMSTIIRGYIENLMTLLSSLKRFLSPVRYELNDRLLGLIDRSVDLGLNINDAANARDYLEHNEQGLAFDVVLSQLYEHSVRVDDKFVEDAEAIARSMNIDWSNYGFINELTPK